MMPPQLNVTWRDDGTYIYADVTNADPSAELYVEIRSKATPPNTSTEGVTAGLHKTTDAKGDATFRVPKDFLIPDTPRDVNLIGPMSAAFHVTS
jgi:hypothetical protein